jgi:thiamine pyrophosphokinase
MAIKKLVFIVAGGPLGDRDFLRAQFAALNPGEVICADGGARHTDALGFIPQVIIGDMDSVDPYLLKRYEGQGSRIIRHPRAKKETDTQLALEYALRSVPDEIRIYGALGGRVDHTLANISLLVAAAKRDVAAKLVDEWCEVFIIARQAEIEGTPGQTVSLLPLSSTVSGIELQGFEYPLSGGVMEIGNPYGISNRLQANRGLIALQSGYLLVMKFHQAESFPGGESG